MKNMKLLTTSTPFCNVTHGVFCSPSINICMPGHKVSFWHSLHKGVICLSHKHSKSTPSKTILQLHRQTGEPGDQRNHASLVFGKVMPVSQRSSVPFYPVPWNCLCSLCPCWRTDLLETRRMVCVATD